MINKSLNKYKLVYSHLWQTYGQSWHIRISYIIKLAIIVSKMIALPIASSLIITRISVKDFDGAQQGVILFVCFSLLIGILTPIIKYVGMAGDNKVYKDVTMTYITCLVAADIDYFKF